MVNIRCYIGARDRFTKELLVKKCNCLPDCTSVTYDVEISQAHSRYTDSISALRYALNETKYNLNLSLSFEFKQRVSPFRIEMESIPSKNSRHFTLIILLQSKSFIIFTFVFFYCDFSIDVTSKLFIAFKENNFISINRTEAYTYSDFIASCGGLLGLFMGVSMLSVIELFYYLTLRLCCKMKQQRENRVKQSTWARRYKHRKVMENHFQKRKF